MIHCPTNEFYGHAEIFRKYARIEKRIPINGRLQHGWAPDAGIIAGDSLDKQGINFFVWNEINSRVGYNIDHSEHMLDPKRTHIVGAPILYAKCSVFNNQATGVLAIPNHSIATKNIQMDAWANYCRHVLYTYGCKTDILVHPRDIENGCDRIIREFGLGVRTCGKMSDPNYLHNQIAILQSYEYIVSNCIQTAVFHALYLGKYVLIDGPEMPTDIPDVNPHIYSRDWIGKNFPLLLKGAQSISLGLDTLGSGYGRTPTEIKELMFPHA